MPCSSSLTDGEFQSFGVRLLILLPSSLVFVVRIHCEATGRWFVHSFLKKEKKRLRWFDRGTLCFQEEKHESEMTEKNKKCHGGGWQELSSVLG